MYRFRIASVLFVSIFLLGPAKEQVAAAQGAPDELVGIWDAILTEEEPRVITTEFRRNGPSYVAMAVGARTQTTYLYLCPSISWMRNRLEMTCHEVGETADTLMTIKGRGFALDGDGWIKAEFVMQTRDGAKTRARWKASLFNMGGNYIEYLALLKKKAGDLIVQARKLREPAK